MSFPKILVIIALVLFSTIGIAAVVKKIRKGSETIQENRQQKPIEIALPAARDARPVRQVASRNEPAPAKPAENSSSLRKLPHADRVAEFFNKNEPKFPIVETITYRSRVSWQKGRPAWLADYATYYITSRHFIARSLNGKPEYFKQDVAEGDRFNVFRKDKDVCFHLLVDNSRCRMWLYYVDNETHNRVLVKDYVVGLGREDKERASGYLTPTGRYSLGNKIAIYKPKMTGFHNGQKVEMVRVFGSRWIPFEKDIADASAPAKGLGLHGVPWVSNDKGDLVEDSSSLGKYTSDGCIRLATKDIEEIFAIIITKPTTIEIVTDFHQAKLPGTEK